MNMRIIGNGRKLKEVVNSAIEVNLTNEILKITEVSENYATIETNSECLYSLGYTNGVDCVTIYEEMVEDNEPLMMDYVGHIYGNIKDILSDKDAIELLETKIVEHETRKYDRD